MLDLAAYLRECAGSLPCGGQILLGASWWPLQNLSLVGDGSIRATLVRHFDRFDSAQLVIMWVDASGRLLAITDRPDFLIESPDAYSRLRWAAIAITLPDGLVSSLGLQEGAQVVIQLDSRMQEPVELGLNRRKLGSQ